MIYAFTFDASACSGCKACQVACKDKNNLPLGVLWRRVYEVSGGSWQRFGDAWVTDVFAYNLSVSCNHCIHPKCAGVCPTDAYIVREDGIVTIDESKCMGCGYCNWACPYGAPQFNPELGKMTKCNFCFDNIDAGLPPACVTACPLRVLDYISVSPLPQEEGKGVRALWKVPASEHPFPLPNYSRTEPHLAIKFHDGMHNGLEKAVSNREEVRPPGRNFKIRRFWFPNSPDFEELPLVAFTLLGQMAAGMAVLSYFAGPLPAPILITIGFLIGLAGLAALLHLGSPMNAWRSIVHLRKSWLSREILMFVLFGASWLVSLAMPGMGKLLLSVCGIGLVYSMARVYRLRSIPAWDSNRTLLAFAVSAVSLGGLGLLAVDPFPHAGSMEILPLVLIAGLVVALGVALTGPDPAQQTVHRLRLGLIGLGMVGTLAIHFVPNTVWSWFAVPICIIVLIGEGIGRWQFYGHLHRRDV